MGMGEPLDNYDAVIQSISAMVDQGQFCLSPSKISISTVGIVPRMIQLMSDAPKIGLALSLHAPNQELRQQIVPTAKAFNIHRILDAADKFVKHQNETLPGTSRRRVVLVEYVLIAGINDSETVATELGLLLKGRNVLLNVLPYNETNVPFDYKRPDREVASKFVEMTRSHGVWTILRQTLGNDASAACGQLVVNQQCGSKDSAVDMEDLGLRGGATGSSPGSTAYAKKRRRNTGKLWYKNLDFSSALYIGMITSGVLAISFVLWSRR